MRTTQLLLAAVLLVWHAPVSAAVDGTVLALSGGNIVGINSTTLQSTVICNGPQDWSDDPVHGELWGPCFSPDGRQVAFSRYLSSGVDPDGVRICIADNDGTDESVVCVIYRTGTFCAGGTGVEASWAANGYVYWSEDDQYINRVNILTKQKEHVAQLSQFSGSTPSRVDNLKVSLDGTRAGCMVNGSGECTGLDLAGLVAYQYGMGCQGTASPNGQFITHNAYGGGYAEHQMCLIRNLITGESVDTVIAAGAVPGQHGTDIPQFGYHRFSHSSNNHVVYTGEAGLARHGFVHQIDTKEYVDLGNVIPLDFWEGALPPPPGSAPHIALDASSLDFVSTGTVPGPQTVTVTNDGDGTLGVVALQNVPAWLEVAVSGTGNTQLLTNTVDVAGFAAGAYNAVVTVHGGGASNACNYTVTLNVGSAVLAPSALNATQTGETQVTLSWTDNSDNEEGFRVERMTAGGAYTEIASVAANVTTYTDDAVTTQTTYTYRVRAYLASDHSGYTVPAEVTPAPTRSITVLQPQDGTQWPVGSTQYVVWTVQNVDKVSLRISHDDGETWSNLLEESVANTDPQFGNYPVTVPPTVSSAVRVRVEEYGDAGVNGLSGLVSTSSSSVAAGGMQRMHSAGLLTMSRSGARGTVVFHLAASAPAVCVYSLSGTLVTRIAAGTGTGRVSWTAPSGTYIARMTGEVAGTVFSVGN